MSEKHLIIRGARQNNLKNIDLVLPHNQVVAITGVSGSGKSSLAFDTVFAEGQWRFIESLSTYARLFLEKMDRPDVDEIHNIRPAIALEQKNPVRGSRSTVGTLTELYDLFRLLYAKIAAPYCPVCGGEIRMWDPSQVVAELLERFAGEKAIIVFTSEETAADLRKRGFHRIFCDGETVDLNSFPDKDKLLESVNKFDVVLDRLVIGGGPRLPDSIEMAWSEGRGKLKVIIIGERDRRTLVFSSSNTCDNCDIEIASAYPLLFSFNHPVGACPECRGFGNILNYDEDLIMPDKNLPLSQGAVDPWNKLAYRWWNRQMLKCAAREGLDIHKPYSAFTDKEKALLFRGGGSFRGIDDFFEAMEDKKYKLHIRVFLSRYRRPVTCSLCRGKRLRRDALAYKISGFDIADLCAMTVTDLIDFFRDLDLSPFQKNMAKEILDQIALKLGFLKRVRLDYLSLSRDGRTLSGGEYQRVNLSNQIASFLTGTLYVLDEPTVGLHARDTDTVAGIMSELSRFGNTILVVEHDRGVIESADWVVELGPGGGDQGGSVIFSGSKEKFLKAATLTSRFIRRIDTIASFPWKRRSGDGSKILLRGATGNNLKSVDFEIPLKTFISVTGVSGSGKSSLIVQTLYRILADKFRVEQTVPLPYKKIEGIRFLKGIRLISQSPIGRSPRSNPVTYLKIFDHIRRLFADQLDARASGYGPGVFSFNVAGGRCEACKGAGYQKMEMYFFEDLYVTCEVCNGKRYAPEALRVTYRGKTIHDVLNLTVDEALEIFSALPNVQHKLKLMQDIGLGYIRLGQPATALSGGEAQRLKICAEIMNMTGASGMSRKDTGRKGFLYILEEPTTGLHFRDVRLLLDILHRIVDAGNTIIVVEHNLDVIEASDWIVDLGPEGGDKGGQIVFAGQPEDITSVKESYTGRYLRENRRAHEPTV